MKTQATLHQSMLTALAISLLAFSPLGKPANYDSLELQHNLASEEEPFSPFNKYETAPSFLESIQQAEVNKEKKNYLAVLNLLKQNQLKEAKAKIAALLKENPNVPEYYNLEALANILEKNPDAALQSYQKALAIDSRNNVALLGLGQVYLAKGELDKAKEFANKVLGINDKNIYAYGQLAEVAYKQKQYPEVEKLLLTALEKVKGDLPLEIRVINDLTKLYGLQKQPEKLLALGEDLVKRYPNATQALSVLAGAQLVNNKKNPAEQTLRKIIGQEKQDVNDRLLLAQLLMGQAGKENEILALLDEAIAIDPSNTRPLAFKIAYLTKLQRFHEAMQLANKAAAQFPKSNAGKALQGGIYLAEKKFDKALESYQQAYKMQANEQLLFIITDLLSAQKKLPEAVAMLNKALEKNPKNSPLRFKLATVYQQLNDTAQAEKQYQAILAEQPDHAMTLNNLAWLYAQQNKPQALGMAKKAYEKAPNSPAIADTYGYILVKQGQPEEGLAVLEKAASAAPAANDIQLHLAEAYAAAKNNSKAIEILEKITQSKQAFPEQKAAVELLNKLKAD